MSQQLWWERERETTQPFALLVRGTTAPLVGCFACSPAEGMQIGPEQKIVPLAEGNAQSPQHGLDLDAPFGATPAARGKTPQKVQINSCRNCLDAWTGSVREPLFFVVVQRDAIVGIGVGLLSARSKVPPARRCKVCAPQYSPVSYTHLTLPTILLV